MDGQQLSARGSRRLTDGSEIRLASAAQVLKLRFQAGKRQCAVLPGCTATSCAARVLDATKWGPLGAGLPAGSVECIIRQPDVRQFVHIPFSCIWNSESVLAVKCLVVATLCR